MGAFDWISEKPRCYRCGEEQPAGDQTKFFSPEFGGQHDRDFRKGAVYPADVDFAELRATRHWEGDWTPLARWDGGALTVVADSDTLHTCACGVPLLARHTFAVDERANTLALTDAETWPLLDASELGRAHFCDSDSLARWRRGADGRLGRRDGWRQELEAVLDLPRAERILAVHRAMVLRTVESASAWRTERELPPFARCLWCASSWKAWIVELEDRQRVLVADFEPWRAVFGRCLDELVESIPGEDEFKEALAWRGT